MIIDKFRAIFSNRSSTIISLGLLLFINFIFTAKYSARYVDTPYFLASAYLLFLFAAYSLPKMIRSAFPFRKAIFALLLLYVVITLIFLLSIPKESLRVDRWWMIQTFLDNLFTGVFPYTPQPHSNIPGPFPVYYVLLLPFYMIGEIAFITLIMLIVMVKIMSAKNNNPVAALSVLILLFGSSAFAWEVITRSTIFFNMVLVILYFILFDRINHEKYSSLIAFGILGGFVLSTRSVVALPMMIFFLFNFLQKKKFKELFIQFVIIVVTFLMTFLPLYFWDSKLFFIYNPILVQSGFTSGWILPAILFVALVFGLMIRTKAKIYFVSGLILFLAVLVPFLITVYSTGFNTAVFKDGFDISYFIFSLPFFLVYLVFNSTAESI